jgi:octaprenyl-diphosphate synthase
MNLLEKIGKPVEDNLKQFEPYFRNSIKTNVSLLNIITNYIIKRKGKQMRPLFVFLTAKMLGEPTETTKRAASLIELMHTATLIHDDVVDDAHIRRNAFSINALWKNKIAVLVGDFLLSKGLLISLENEEYGILKIITDAVKEMSEGELLQLEKSRKLNITEEIYYQIITKKTAVLIASCMATGAKSVNVSNDVVQKMWEIGINAGISFQIKDDLFDYQNTNLIGKPTGNDIKERKLTLPLIFSLKNASENQRKHILSLMKIKNKSNKIIDEIHSFAKNNGGIEYSHNQMVAYKNTAINLLADFPDNNAKQSLKELINYVIDRNK